MVVPEPQNGSYTAWSGEELFSIGRRMHSTGFCVPWTVSASWSRDAMDHNVVCLRSPQRWEPGNEILWAMAVPEFFLPLFVERQIGRSDREQSNGVVWCRQLEPISDVWDRYGDSGATLICDS